MSLTLRSIAIITRGYRIREQLNVRTHRDNALTIVGTTNLVLTFLFTFVLINFEKR